jgi:hypothetical protein
LGLHLSECSGIISVDAELGGGSALQSVGVKESAITKN